MFSRMVAAAKGAAQTLTTTSHPLVNTTVRVERYSVTVIKPLAEGGFAVVFLVQDNTTGVEYALKKILANDPDAAQMIVTEIAVMKKLQGSEYVVKLLAAEQKSNGKFKEFWLLMELCTGGHVVDLMNTRLDNPFTEQEALKIFLDTCKGLQVMHKQNPPIAHRDIKPENVLLQNGLCKLCDFGSASTNHGTPGEPNYSIADVEDDILKNTTLQYRAPEQVELYQNKRISEKVDIWAMGVLLFKILYFQDAFGESTLAILGARYKIPSSPPYSENMKQLIRLLLEPDPDKRLDINQTIQHVEALLKGKPLGSGGFVKPASPPKPTRPPASQPPATSNWNAFGDNAQPTHPPVPAKRAPPPPVVVASGGGEGSVGGWADFGGAQPQQPPTTPSPNPFANTPTTSPPAVNNENPFATPIQSAVVAEPNNPFGSAMEPQQQRPSSTPILSSQQQQHYTANPFADAAAADTTNSTKKKTKNPFAASNRAASTGSMSVSNPFEAQQQQEQQQSKESNPFLATDASVGVGRNPFLKKVSL